MSWQAFKVAFVVVAVLTILLAALNARKQKRDAFKDAFGDYPHMTPLDTEWMKRNRNSNTICKCDRELRGA